MDEKEFFVRYTSLVREVCAPERLKRETWERLVREHGGAAVPSDHHSQEEAPRESIGA